MGSAEKRYCDHQVFALLTEYSRVFMKIHAQQIINFLNNGFATGNLLRGIQLEVLP